MALHAPIGWLAAAALALAAPGARTRSDAPLQKVTLVATDYRFSPSVVHAVAGQPLEITIVNRGTHTHGLRLALSYGEVPFSKNVPPGRTVSEVFNNLGDPGTYRFYCPVEDHQQRGMSGSITVAAAR